MKSGVISGNKADGAGGGVFIDWGNFSMTAGVLYGTNADAPLKNTATSGAAVYKEGNTKETTISTYPYTPDCPGSPAARTPESPSGDSGVRAHA
jgi:hypothetical protein